MDWTGTYRGRLDDGSPQLRFFPTAQIFFAFVGIGCVPNKVHLPRLVVCEYFRLKPGRFAIPIDLDEPTLERLRLRFRKLDTASIPMVFDGLGWR